MLNSYYVDSCIYLNLWQKEKNKLGRPLWKYAKDFFDKAEQKNEIIYYSGYLLKEISYLLSEKEFKEKLIKISTSKHFIRKGLSEKEFHNAQELEIKLKKKISFFDILHLLIARKTNSILITRDRELLKVAKKFKIRTSRPEDLL